MRNAEERWIRLAKRDNNPKRPYLFVNPEQGKHIPADPGAPAGLGRMLAEKLAAAYPDDRLYVIGFAETATGIAAAACSYLTNAVYYQNTTRERRENAEYLYFEETHSHAVEQLLRSERIAEYAAKSDRIVFVDDEVTTGSTVCRLIAALRGFCPPGTRWTVASVLNSMTAERMEELREQGVECVFLSLIPHEYRADSVRDTEAEAERHLLFETPGAAVVPDFEFRCPADPRNALPVPEYIRETRRFSECVRALPGIAGHRLRRVLVLGTEEFMYPSFVVGEMLRQQGYAEEVRVHATTRSPILASGKPGYPLHHRYQIRSPYDPDRITYVYNLEAYDLALILTDAPGNPAGLAGLKEALRSAGTGRILTVRWND